MAEQPTRILMAEHEEIKEMLRILMVMADRLEAGQEVPSEHLEGALDFITGFADRCHHAKEEDLLFPAMEEVGIPKQGGPIGVMLVEHEQGRSHVRAMKDALTRMTAGEEQARQQWVVHAREYAALLEQHIFKEDNILYAMADARLSEEQQQELKEEFERVEREIVGKGKHEYFEQILSKLKEIYG